MEHTPSKLLNRIVTDENVTSSCIALVTKLAQRQWYMVTEQFAMHGLLTPCIIVPDFQVRTIAIKSLANLVPITQAAVKDRRANVLAQAMVQHEITLAGGDSFLDELRGMLEDVNQQHTALKIYRNLTYNCDSQLAKLLSSNLD